MNLNLQNKLLSQKEVKYKDWCTPAGMKGKAK